jgi:hypothetical protein
MTDTEPVPEPEVLFSKLSVENSYVKRYSLTQNQGVIAELKFEGDLASFYLQIPLTYNGTLSESNLFKIKLYSDIRTVGAAAPQIITEPYPTSHRLFWDEGVDTNDPDVPERFVYSYTLNATNQQIQEAYLVQKYNEEYADQQENSEAQNAP